MGGGSEFLSPELQAALKGDLANVTPEQAHNIVQQADALGEDFGLGPKMAALREKAAQYTPDQATTGATPPSPPAPPPPPPPPPEPVNILGNSPAKEDIEHPFSGTGGLDALGAAMANKEFEEEDRQDALKLENKASTEAFQQFIQSQQEPKLAIPELDSERSFDWKTGEQSRASIPMPAVAGGAIALLAIVGVAGYVVTRGGAAPSHSPAPAASAAPAALAGYTCPSPTGKTFFDNGNGGAVTGGGQPTTFDTGDAVICLHMIETYHWNGGSGAPPGTVWLVAADGTKLGPYQTKGSPGQNNAQNVNWYVYPPPPVMLKGKYTCYDSDPGTWSQDSATGGHGFCRIDADPAVKK